MAAQRGTVALAQGLELIIDDVPPVLSKVLASRWRDADAHSVASFPQKIFQFGEQPGLRRIEQDDQVNFIVQRQRNDEPEVFRIKTLVMPRVKEVAGQSCSSGRIWAKDKNGLHRGHTPGEMIRRA